MKRRVVFVIGTPRSGSTLLGAMLGSHSSAAFVSEMNTFHQGVRRRRAWRGPGRTCILCDGPCPVWDDRVSGHFAWRRYGALGRAWSRLPAARGFYEELFDAIGAGTLVDSSKHFSWLQTRLRERRDWRDAEPHLIHVSRDGRGTLASFKRRRPDVDTTTHVDRWIDEVRTIGAAFDAFDPGRRASVRYEDLVRRPDETLRELCGALGLDHEPAMAQYWRHDHHVTNGNRGTVSLIARWRAEHEGRARAVLDRRGDREHYQGLGYALVADRRWQDELDDADLALSEAKAGGLNRELGYD